MIMIHVWPSNQKIIVSALWLALSASALKLKIRSKNQMGRIQKLLVPHCFISTLFQLLHTVTLQKSHTRFLTKTHKTQNINEIIKKQLQIKHEKSNLCTQKVCVESEEEKRGYRH